MSESGGLAFECSAVREHLDAFVSGELAAAPRKRVQRHLAICADCSRLHEDIALIRARLRNAARRGSAPATLRDSILDRIRGE